MRSKILIIGACGQIGTELLLPCGKKTGKNNVVAADIRGGDTELMKSGPFEIVVRQILSKYRRDSKSI